MFYKLTQLNSFDCGFICLKILMANLSKDKSYLFIKNEKKEEYSFFDLLNVASLHGFKVKAYSVNIENLKNIKNSIVAIKKDGVSHFVIFKSYQFNKITYYDPSNGEFIKMTKKEFLSIFTGNCLILENLNGKQKPKYNPNIPIMNKVIYLSFKIMSLATLALAFFFINTYFWSFTLILASFLIELIASYFKRLSMKRFDNLYILNKDTFLIVQKIKESTFSLIDAYFYSFISILIITILIALNEPYMLILVGLTIVYRLLIRRFYKQNELRIASKEKKLDDFKDILDSSYKVVDKYLLLNYAFYIFIALVIMLIMKINGLTQLNYFLFYFFTLIFLANNLDSFINRIASKDEYLNYMNQYFDKTT